MEVMLITGLFWVTAMFVAVILLLVAKMKWVRRVSGAVFVFSALSGLFFYAYAYLLGASDWIGVLAAAIHSLLSTFLMFTGKNEASAVERAIPWFAGNSLVHSIFWLAHFGALFVSSSAIVLFTTFGDKLLQGLRLRFLRTNSLYLFFGVNTSSLLLGADIRKNSLGKIIYVAPKFSAEQKEKITELGGLVCEGTYLENGTLNLRAARVLKNNRRAKSLYFLALDESESTNAQVAKAALTWCSLEKIPHETAHILFRNKGDTDYRHYERFIPKSGDDGLYNVDMFSESELAARLLIRKAPPYKTLSFDEKGKALQDFCTLIIGFGEVGQQSLRKIVMNSQFYGSEFSAIVVDRAAENIVGQFKQRYIGMLETYNIKFHAIDIRSQAFFELLGEIAPKLNYIVIALGDDDANFEAITDLERYFTRIGVALGDDDDDTKAVTSEGRSPLFVNVCNKQFVGISKKGSQLFDNKEFIYTVDNLLRKKLDTLAEAVNFSYVQNAEQSTIAAEWKKVDYFDRESNRAAADFTFALLHIAGLTDQQALDQALFDEKIKNNQALLEVLSITEHLRWNGFHYAMGYTSMPFDEVKQRKAQGEKSIQKDKLHLRHACLVAWDELDGVSALVSELNGKKINYKKNDSDNILNIPRVLALMRDS